MVATGYGMYFEWYPANGDPKLTFKWDTPIRMVSSDGLTHADTSGVDVKAPGQYGSTLVDVLLNPRKVSFTLVAEGANMSALMTLRAKLARAFLTLPKRRALAIPQGYLRCIRESPTFPAPPVVDLFGIPIASPQVTQHGPHALTADIDLYCPYPFWQDIEERVVPMVASGGFQWPLEFPLEMTSFNTTLVIDNIGDVPAPILIRLYGDATTMRLRNLTTDEQIEVSGNVAAGQYIEIQTEFGQKSITLVNGATRTSIFDRLNLAKADFFWLEPGVNSIAFEANVNVSGYANVIWRPRYAGV